MENMSLKLFFKDICRDLGNLDNVTKQFVELKNDQERFQMAYEICQDYFSRLEFASTGKCNEKSATCRKEGNNLFMNYSYWKALTLYNKSLALAKNNSTELGLAYGNRASCLLRLNFPKEALSDVEKALNLCTTQELKNKLLMRQKQCLLAINNKIQPCGNFSAGNVPSLSRGKSSYFSSASSAVDLSTDKHGERKLVVNSDINVGEVLIVEKPFSSIVLAEHFYTHCSYCFKRDLNLVPCVSCCTAMFCNEQCLASKSHDIECSYLEILSSLNADRRELLSLKILIDASNQGRQLDKLYDEVAKYDNNDYDQNNQFYDSSDFVNIYNLVTNSKKRAPTDLFYRSVISAILIFTLQQCTNFFKLTNIDRRKNMTIFCGGLILRLMQSLPCNAHEVSEYNCESLLEIGAGAYATLSLINHSCDPNVVRYSCQDKIVLCAIKPIKNGEQIFDNYGYHYATHDFQERQEALLEQYYFKCECEACLNMWPTYNQLIELPLRLRKNVDISLYNKLTKDFEDDMQEVLNGKHNTSIIERNTAYLEFLHEAVELPWLNYNKCQELIKHCLNFQANYFKME
ncbi:hypothetical protein RUM43_003645 [Polyplax serrata]|uniref:SET domain-containing protein n=1 Tax=Polyplax serrata TaxID=468196 RepID=A0AAN8S3B0_POLSC